MVEKTSEKKSIKVAKMAKSAHLAGGEPPIAKDDGDVPEVLRFEARLFQHPRTRAAAKSGLQTLLDVPEWVGKKFLSRAVTGVEGTMNGHPFRATLELGASGDHRLRVNKAMLKGAGARSGDTVKLVILEPESEPAVPADLRVALAASREAKALWDGLTSMGRRDWVRWIESAKRPETRTRRLTRTVEQLSSGKRRPCCVNVYEFMLRRVREDEKTEGS